MLANQPVVPVSEQDEVGKPPKSVDTKATSESKEADTVGLSREDDGLKVSQFWFRSYGFDDNSIEKGLLMIIASYYGKYPVRYHHTPPVPA